MLELTRRNLLKIAGGAALIHCGTSTSSLEESKREPLDAELAVDDALFPLSVMAGDATPTGIVLMTRYLGAAPLRLRIWEESTRKTWYSGQVQPDADGFVHIEADGLAPGRSYRYAFTAGDARSGTGNFKTAWSEDTLAPLTFGGTSCTHQRRWPWPVLADAATRDLAFFVHNGDHVYADKGTTRDEYRAIYEASYKQSGMRLMHEAFTFYGVWDDHEFAQNFDPETFPKERLQAAMGTYLEHVPIRGNQMYRSYQWGRTAELFMLDCRMERKPSTRSKKDAQYISQEQMQWLKNGLRNSRAQFKFIINSVPIARFNGLWDVERHDRWQGYPGQREELLSLIEEEISGVWFCSGDFHLGAIGRVEERGRFSTIPEILWGPAGQIINLLHYTLANGNDNWDHVVAECNYTMLTCDPESNTLRIRFVGEQGNDLLDVTYPNS